MTKTRIAVLISATAASLFATAALANPFIAPHEPVRSSVQSTSPYSFELGLTAHREKYTEKVGGEKYMQQEADFVGIQGAVIRQLDHGGKLKFSGMFAAGQSEYTGAYQGGNYGDVTVDDLDRYLLGAELEYKYAVRDWSNIVVGAGLGYRRLVDRLDQAGAGGYKRTNDRLFASLSLEREFAAGNWTITPQAKYKHLIWGVQQADLVGGVKMKQDKGYGTEFAIAISHRKAWNGMTVTPYLRTWDIEKSQTVRSGKYSMYEPSNKTKEIGVAVSFVF